MFQSTLEPEVTPRARASYISMVTDSPQIQSAREQHASARTLSPRKMYHTFAASSTSATAPAEAEGTKSSRPNGGSRRISTTNACSECRRRKIRCDGNQPCGQCLWYQHPEICAYAKPAQRVVPSKKLVERLQSQVEQYRSVLMRLFPGKELEDLQSLDREALINLVVTLPNSSASPSDTIDHLYGVQERSESTGSLDELEQGPDLDPNADETTRWRDGIQGISDDVNRLSFAVDQASSYTGVSSTNAAIKVILKTAPVVRPFILQAAADSSESCRVSMPPQLNELPDLDYLPPAEVRQKYVDSYFARVHVFVPMIDEEQFRRTYLQGDRTDTPWLGLINTVLALGSLASSDVGNEDHLYFSQQARRHLMAESFGSSNLLVLQATALFCGYYLHWPNRPNEANALMGAVLRMATAHGLHREYGDSTKTLSSSCAAAQSPAEIRRRTWWSLYCLDSWACITTGWPSGRTGPGITVQAPRTPEQKDDTEDLKALRLLPFIQNIGLCKIATKVQDALASKSIIDFEELFALDAELERWHEELPPILKEMANESHLRIEQDAASQRRKGAHSRQMSPGELTRRRGELSRSPGKDRTTCPEELITPRAIIHWRYQNLRILITRPWLLAATLRRTPFSDMSSAEKTAVSRCRIVASQTIADIEATCEENLIAGWNAVHLMYHAVMVPLVSLFSVLAMQPAPGNSPAMPRSDHHTPTPGSDEDVERWRQDIERAIQFLDSMQPWSTIAKKSRDVVQRLYDATKFVDENPVCSRNRSVEPPQSLEVDSANNSRYNSTPRVRNLNFANPDEMSDLAFMPEQPWTTGPELRPSTGIDANNFWDEMMWETSSSGAIDPLNLAEGTVQFEWWSQNIASGSEPQEWSPWSMSDHNVQ